MTQWGLDTLFNPAKRHMDEEKRRLQSTREEIGDSSGGKRIDFESGKVTIRRATSATPGTEDDPEDDTEDQAVGGEPAEDGDAATTTVAADTGATDTDTDTADPADPSDEGAPGRG